MKTTNNRKAMLLAIVLCIGAKLPAQNYYVSASDPLASDGNSGMSISAPWQSFAPLNTLLSSPPAVDTIFLKSGDIFREQLNVTGANGFVITSYGTGDKPVISGADTVFSWTSAGIYFEAAFSQPVTNFFANDREQILARYPDEGAYLKVDMATSNYLQDADLSGLSAPVLNQSQVCVHTDQWCWEKSPIASSAGNRINYANPTIRVPKSGYGYFLYDDLSYLTNGKEWKYDAVAQKVYFKPASGNPNTFLCEASVREYGILLGTGVSDVSIINITFEKQAGAGVALLDSTNINIQIDQCYFARQYKYGVEVQGRFTKISNSYFREVDGLGVYIHATGFAAEVHHNMFRNIGGFRNSGIGQEINLSAIKGAFVDSCYIHHNDIDSTGYCGISLDGKWNLIERNVVKNAMLLNNDGAALKSFGVGSQYNVFRNNFVSLSDGNTEGTPNGSHFITPALYFDFSTNHCTMRENTIYNHTQKGIFLNSGTNHNTVTGNVVYGGNYCLDFNGSPLILTPMAGMVVKHNYLFAKDPNAYILRKVDSLGGLSQGVVDSNYYFQPYNEGRYAFLPPSDSYTFSEWQMNTGFDLHSRSSFVNWTLPNGNDTLFMNQTDDVVTISLGNITYLDLDSNVVCGSLTLQPYTSRILINTGMMCATGISANTEGIINIFPNPCSSEIYLNTNRIVNGINYRIMNELGQIVGRGTLAKGITKIEVTGLKPGIYTIQAQGMESQALRVVKL